MKEPARQPDTGLPVEHILEIHGVRPTAVRILIYRCLERLHDTFSMTDVEQALDTVDKSTVFRTLTLFAEHHLLHATEDGNGLKKYCLCHNDHVCRPEEMHCHFYCEHCHRTLCLDSVAVPAVKLPDGFLLTGTQYLLRGLCPDCSGERRAESGEEVLGFRF